MKKKSVVTPSRRHVHALFAGLPCSADVAFEKGSARAKGLGSGRGRGPAANHPEIDAQRSRSPYRSVELAANNEGFSDLLIFIFSLRLVRLYFRGEGSREIVFHIGHTTLQTVRRVRTHTHLMRRERPNDRKVI